MAVGDVPLEVFERVGHGIINASRQYPTRNARRFRAMFGVPSTICPLLWHQMHLRGTLPKKGQPKHLLWALMFLKLYEVELAMAARCGVDEKTYRKWVWAFLPALSSMNVICWEKRKTPMPHKCYVSLDGTDFRIQEPSPFDPKWYSHKFKGPGLRYEIGISIASGDIVWAYGPAPCGSWSDLKIARTGIVRVMEHGEMIIADGGYKDARYFITPNGLNNRDSRIQTVIRARHETVNRRFKQFSVLGNRFRHPLEKHGLCAHAVFKITQSMIENGYPLFNPSHCI